MKYLLILVFVFLGIVNESFGQQNHTLKGTLKEKNTGDRIYFPYKWKGGWEGLNIIYEPII